MTRPSLQYLRRLPPKATRGQFWPFFTVSLFFTQLATAAALASLVLIHPGPHGGTLARRFCTGLLRLPGRDLTAIRL
jgi:hypothetical protein